jgi:hypothetical protein
MNARHKDQPVRCQAPKPTPRRRKARREFQGGECGKVVPRKMRGQRFCSDRCRRRSAYWFGIRSDTKKPPHRRLKTNKF